MSPATETAVTSTTLLDALDQPDDDGVDTEALLDPLVTPAEPLDEGELARFALPFSPRLTLQPRPYQREALRRWLGNGGRGVVVLPTGAGKTVVALMALEQVPARTLVVVPTIDLLRQWRAALIAKAGVPGDEVGLVGGGERRARSITVMTYDSAAMPRRDLSAYGLLIVDEVHHLPAPTYRAIAARAVAPWRLGLSATPERGDGAHLELGRLVGAEVYRRLPAELAAAGHIAQYREKRIFVNLTADERYRYDALMAEFKWFLATQRSRLMGRNPFAGAGQHDAPSGSQHRLHGTLFEQLIQRSATDPAARRALQAHHQARLIALNAEAKISEVERLLQHHGGENAIVFSEYNAMVRLLSRRLALPAITYRTDPDERRHILDSFRAGRFSKLVTGRVLNEGVDVPDANVAIVVSGSAATREYIQRLGRVLRPKPREAVLYEIISRGTTEARTARLRRPAH